MSVTQYNCGLEVTDSINKSSFVILTPVMSWLNPYYSHTVATQKLISSNLLGLARVGMQSNVSYCEDKLKKCELTSLLGAPSTYITRDCRFQPNISTTAFNKIKSIKLDINHSDMIPTPKELNIAKYKMLMFVSRQRFI